MKPKEKQSHPDMLTWQYRTIMAELGQVTLHASDDSCPCNQVDLGADGKHHPEYCLGKHLLNVQSLCLETALMDEPHRDMLEEMASRAFEHHEAAKTIYCEGGTWPDLAQWSRDARKKIEPIYYSCDVKLKEDLEEAKLFETPRKVKVAGTYKSGAYNFKVSHTAKTEAVTNSVEELPETIEDVLRRIKEKKQEVSNRTFAFGTTGLVKYEFFYRIVDGENLIVSNDPFTFEPNPNYPQELQPRKRERAAAELQVKRIAADLIPDVLLVDFRSTDRGAPIIGDDLVVESGNGRVMALILASRDAPAKFAEYVAALKRIAPAYALSAADAAKYKIPVLVRERLTPVNRKDFAQDCNSPVALEQSAIEKARTDAEKMTVEMLRSIAVAEGQSVEDAIRSPSNKNFVVAFLNKLPQNEQAKLLDASGVLNSDGLRRIILAMFVATLKGDTGLKLAEIFFESTDTIARKGQRNIKRIYTPVVSQRIYEVVVPKDGEKTELTFAPQEVIMTPARREPAEQAAMFEGREARLSDVFTVKMKVFSRDNKSFKEYDATVDTGADWCGIPEDDIKELGLDYYGTLPTQTPKEIYEPGYYFGQVEVEGVRAAGLFAVSSYPIVGARFLQFGGFKVNPVEHKLERIPFFALGQAAMFEEKTKLEAPMKLLTGEAAMCENPTVPNLLKSMKDELRTIVTYRKRGTDVDPKTQQLYRHISKEEYDHYAEFRKRAEKIGGRVSLSDKSNLPICTVTKAKKLERCILKVKKKGTAVNPFAVCMVSVGCRKGGSKMSESGDTIKITGTCEDSPDKCVYTLKRVGDSLKIVGTKQLSRAIEGQGLKESVPVKVLTAIKNPVEVKV